MKLAKLFFLGLTVVWMLGAQTNAQLFKLPFGANKSQSTVGSVQLTQNAGPWLIMCASFSGSNGQQQAFRLAQELREAFRLKAYVYRHNRDIAQDFQGKGVGWEIVQEAGEHRVRPKQMKLAAGDSVEEIAVLVGDFSSIEDSAAQKTMAHIKAVHPRTMADYDTQPDSKTVGPLKAAFLMPNPMLPDEYFEVRKIDESVLKWNSKTKYSLLKNPGAYSVRVATFDGDSSFELDQIQQTTAKDLWMKKKGKVVTSSKLVNAAKKATVLTAALRKQGIEAYEFHDRLESYVCVGGYDWMVQEGADGKKRNNPDMVAVIKKFKGEVLQSNGAMRTYKLPDKLVRAGIACDVQPIPVLIPKASTSRSAVKKIFGRYR